MSVFIFNCIRIYIKTEQNLMKKNLNSNPSNHQLDISQYLFSQDSKHQDKNYDPIIHEIPSLNKNQLPPLFTQNVYLQENLFRSANSIPMSFVNQEFKLSTEAYNFSQSEVDNDDSHEKTRKQQSKNKVYAKNYREKKKQKMKNFQEQNRFLKSKIDDLSFRLKQTQLELNKLKHNHPSTTQNFHITRQSILKQIQKILESQEHTNLETLLQVQKKMRGLNAFESKQKKDLLNYFMNELLQNLINDYGLYFVDCITEKSGFWKAFDIQQARRIDLEIADLLGEQAFERVKQLIQGFPELALNHMRNFKKLWKKLYEDYINIINQGIMIETLCRPHQQKNIRQNYQNQVLNYFKLQLYFQKIKYRKDMRQLRESWFLSNSAEEQEARTNRLKLTCKKIKIATS